MGGARVIIGKCVEELEKEPFIVLIEALGPEEGGEVEGIKGRGDDELFDYFIARLCGLPVDVD